MRKKQMEDKIYQLFDYLHDRIITVIVIVAILTFLISMILILTDEKEQEPVGSEITEYEEMETVYFAMDKVQSLNPLSSQEEDTYYISKLVFSSLFRLDAHLNVEKDLVSSYENDAGKGVVEIELRQDAEFSDGTSLNAYDVKYTIDQISYLGDKYPYYVYADKIDYIEITGDYSFTVYFKKASDAALDNLVFPIVCSNSFDRADEAPVGSGVYRYGTYANHKVLDLKPNEKYYGEKAQNELVFKVISDKSKVPGLMTIDSITAAVVTDSAVSIEAEDKKLNVTPIASNEMEYLGFNFKHKYLKKVKVRQAIAKTIDLEAIIRDSYGDMGMVSDTIYFPNFLDVENTGDPYSPDQVGASQLLKACGFSDSDGNGILEDKDGKEFALGILVNRDDEKRTDAAKTIAAELQKVGIKADVETLSWKSYKEALKDGDFDLYLGGYSFDSQYNLKEMFEKDNFTGYDNEAARKLVNTLETAISAEEQKENFIKLKNILVEDLPYYCLAYKTYSFISVNHFSAEMIPNYHHRYHGCDTWKWEKVMTTQVEETEQ